MSGVPGAGLARGLAVTLRTLLKPSVTQQYPHVTPELPPRSRGVIALLEENCTVCMLCARECPDWCIYIDSHKEVVPPKEEGARPRTRNILDRFAIDYALCMYCGICVEVCPFDALFWSPEFEYATYDVLGLTHEKERLRDWMATVPPPPATLPSAEQGKELDSVLKAGEAPARPERGERPERPERPERSPRAERPDRPPRTETPDQPTAPIPTAVPGSGDVTEPSADVPPTAAPGGEADAATAPDDGGPA